MHAKAKNSFVIDSNNKKQLQEIIAKGAGAVLGGLSSKSGNNKCLNCGHSWKI